MQKSVLRVIPPTAWAPARMASAAAAGHVKQYARFKRASQIMADVKSESQQRRDVFLANWRPAFPRFEVGDAVEVVYAAELGEAEAPTIRGTVMGKVNRGIDSSFTIINSADGDVYAATYKLSSPLLRSVRVMRRAHVTNGSKVRRNKLTHLWSVPSESVFKVTRDTKEQWELDLEKRIRKELASRGRVASKKAVLAEKQRLVRTGKGILQVDRYA